MTDLPRASVLVRWVPFTRRPPRPARPAPADTADIDAAPTRARTAEPWSTGRHDPTRETAPDVPDRSTASPERHAGDISRPERAARAEIGPPGAHPTSPERHPRGIPRPESAVRGASLAPPLIPAPPVPAPHTPDLARVSPEPLLRRPARRPRREPRGAVVDGIEHRPPIDTEDEAGLSRLLRGRTGSRLMAVFFLAVYLLILLQLIYSLMNR